MIPTTSSNPFSPLFGSGNKGLAPSLNAPCPGINMLHCRRGLQHITCVIVAAKSRGASGFALVTTQSPIPGLLFRLLIVTRTTDSSSCKCTNSARNVCTCHDSRTCKKTTGPRYKRTTRWQPQGGGTEGRALAARLLQRVQRRRDQKQAPARAVSASTGNELGRGQEGSTLDELCPSQLQMRGEWRRMCTTDDEHSVAHM